MKVTQSSTLPDILILDPEVHTDQRGHFLETYQAERYIDLGMPHRFLQDNLSCSKKGVLRGLHYQLGRPQAKLIWVLYGEVFDVAVDIRKGSPTFGRWVSFTLSSENYRQIYVPEGFAHGFCATSEVALFYYKCTDYYAPEEERGLRWDDPALSINWPINRPIVSDKDSKYPTLKSISAEHLPALESLP